MAHSDHAAELALRRARRAYERAHVVAALRGLAIAAGLAALGYGLSPFAPATWLVAGALAATLAALGWRGGAARRGALAGVLAGLPPLVAPSVVFVLAHGNHCATCEDGATLQCMIACFGVSSLVGLVVGHRASTDRAPRVFAAAAIASAALTGLLGCGTTGLGGALGVVAGVVAGAVTGWVVGGRAAAV